MPVTRILIIDDDFRYSDTHFTFPDNNARVELTYAKDMGEALNILDAWKNQGVRADIVTLDCFSRIPSGIHLETAKGNQQTLDNWAGENSEYAPKRFFWHSFSMPDATIPEHVTSMTQECFRIYIEQ